MAFLEGNTLAKKKDAGLSLMEFCNEFGVPDQLTIDGSNEQNASGTEFIKKCLKNGISAMRTEPECPNQKATLSRVRFVRSIGHGLAP
jgi:hypothetical protein